MTIEDLRPHPCVNVKATHAVMSYWYRSSHACGVGGGETMGVTRT